MADILLIDDDTELFSLLEDYLKDEGFACTHAACPEEGLTAVTGKSFEAVILDVMLPGMNGFEVLRRIRANEGTARLPVIMLTARGEEIDRVVGLEMGADDYLGKPFSPRELVARLRAVLRRAMHTPDETGAVPEHLDDMTLDPASLCVTVQGVTQPLTISELRLLTQLARNMGQVVGRDVLYQTIFGHPAYPMDRSLDMLVSRLRKKLGARSDGGERIKAVRGEGYMYLKAGGQS